MEQTTSDIEKIKALLSAPAGVSSADADFLRDMATAFPYFKPVHLLLAKATELGSDVGIATLYNGGEACYHAMHDEVLTTQTKEEATPAAEADEQETFEEISEFKSVEYAFERNGPGSEIPDLETQREEKKYFEPESLAVAEAPEIETVTPDEREHTRVSKYDDDTLPYSFLWWLQKTRDAHKPHFQPYAVPRTAQPGELQQQYVEHIFHLQTGLANEQGGTEIGLHKGDEVINAFLRSDPQISPPPLDKINTENKARKSAEDQNDLVSETLAAIYIEQMLYRKAIDTYEKLSLKFPEKSRYFADLIRSLEKKI